MNRRAKSIEAANQLASKIAAQESVPDTVTRLLGSPPSTWSNLNGDQYEWALPSTTIDRMAQSLLARLRALGCSVYNVDTSSEPYYFVCVRYTIEEQP